ncbi:MAG: hypothetical protein OHK0044_27660 [Burkholderiaceae bacterium]
MPTAAAMRLPARPRARAALLAAAVFALGLPQQVHAPGSATRDAQVLFARWMRLDAPSADDAAVAATELARQRERLAAAFAHAVERGPSAEQLEFAFRRSARVTAIARLQTSHTALRRIADEIAQRRQVDRFVRQYRARALLGLALLGDARALERIARHARDRADPLAPEARAALRIVQAN